jgi:chromate reductase
MDGLSCVAYGDPSWSETIMNFLVFCGSFRKGSYNKAIANALPMLAPAGMQFTDAPPFEDFPLYNADKHQANGIPAEVTKLGDAIRAADGIVIVSPEYNYSVPGGLKNAIDWVSRIKDQPFGGKPVSIMSATMGPLGGGRMQYHLRTIMVFLNAHVFNTPEIFVGMAQSKIDEKGEITDAATREFIGKHLAAFEKFAKKIGG